MLERIRLLTVVLAILVMSPPIASSHVPSAGSPRLAPMSLAGTPRPLSVPAPPGAIGRGAAGPTGSPSFPDNWPMYDYNTSRTGTNPDLVSITSANGSQMRQLWSYRTNGSIFTSPAVVNGTVYFGSWDGYLYAVNASNGALRWRTYLGQTTVPACRGNATEGITSSPQFWNGSIYLGGGDSNWYALNATTGGVEWNLSVGNNSATGGNYNWASPLIFHHELYIGLASNCDHPLIRAGVLEVNLSGPLSVKAEYFTVPPGCGGASIWSTPALDPATNTVWITTGNEGPSCTEPRANAVIVLNATTLQELGHWAVPSSAGLDVDFGDGLTFGRSPAGIPLALTTNKIGITYAFNRSNASAPGWGPAWSVTTGDFDDWSIAPAVWNGSDYFVSTSYSTFGGTTYQGSVWGLSPTRGGALWHIGSASGDRLPPGYANGMLAVPSGPNLTVLRSSTGSELVRFTAGYNLTQFGPAVFGDGRLFAGTGSYSGLGSIDPKVRGVLYAYGLPFLSSIGHALLNGPPGATRPVQFWANSSGGTGGVRCAWDFGDGTSGSGCAPTHRYGSEGNYSVRVMIEDDAWESAALNATVSVPPAVYPFLVSLRYSSAYPAAPAPFSFYATLGGAYVPPVNWTWDFGDGNHTTAGTGNVSYTYARPGNFTVTVNATDSEGISALGQLPLSVGPGLSFNASLAPLSGRAPLTVRGAVTMQGGLVPYRVAWNDSNGGSSGSTSYTGIFGVPGEYQVWVTAADLGGFEKTRLWNVSVSAGPSPWEVAVDVGTPAGACGSHKVVVAFGAVISGGAAPFDYTWDFGDGTGSNAGPQVNHTYAAPGNYSLTLEVRDVAGDSRSANPIVQVLAPPPCAPVRSNHSPGGGAPFPLPYVVAGVAAVLLAALAVGAFWWWKGRRGGRK